MKQLKSLPFLLLLFNSETAISQIKKPHDSPQIINHKNVYTLAELIRYGHPWTRNGENVWVAKPPKLSVIPASPLPPPPANQGYKETLPLQNAAKSKTYNSSSSYKRKE